MVESSSPLRAQEPAAPKSAPGDAWAFTKAVGGGVWSGVVGTVEGLWSLAKGGAKLLVDPAARESAWASTKRLASATGQYAEATIDDPAKPYRDARDGVASIYTAVDTARQKAAQEGHSAEFWGNAVGRGAFEIGTLLIPIGAAAKAGKAGEIARAAEVMASAQKEMKATEAIKAAASAAERAQAIAKLPAMAAADAPVSTIEGCAVAKAAKEAATAQKLDELLEKAPVAKKEIDTLAHRVASEVGGTVSEADVKSRARALDKIYGEYRGDPTKVKDLARNTIVTSSGKEEEALAVLKRERPDIRPEDIKIVKADEDPCGYSGIKINVQTESGLPAEVQVNSPEMIYAKEKPENAIKVLGKEKYDEIASRSGMPPGGQGHVMYEQWQELGRKNPNSPEAKAIAEKSRAYYDAVRRRAR